MVRWVNDVKERPTELKKNANINAKNFGPAAPKSVNANWRSTDDFSRR
jgi:hypothetical protein